MSLISFNIIELKFTLIFHKINQTLKLLCSVRLYTSYMIHVVQLIRLTHGVCLWIFFNIIWMSLFSFFKFAFSLLLLVISIKVIISVKVVN